MPISTQDIITAVKNLNLFLKIPKLKGAEVRMNSSGKPFVYVGGFNMVFQLNHRNQKWAFRVWHASMGKNKARFQAISRFLTQSHLDYFTDFIYDENALLVNGKLVDTIRMKWLEGSLLKEYIESNLKSKRKLKRLADEFLRICQSLHDAKISHGDLQHGNIIIDKNHKIHLIDYDSVCVPDIEGQPELSTGLKGYQHPSRFKAKRVSLKSDYFSELVIYLSIFALAENPKLWEKYQVKDTEYLLFSENDFEKIESSEIYDDLFVLSDSIKTLLRILSEYLKEKSYLKLKPFTKYLSAPEIIEFNINKSEVFKGEQVVFNWKVKNADTVSISNVGKVQLEGSKLIRVDKSNYLNLIAENAFGKVEEEICIKVLPLPKIKEFRNKRAKIRVGETTQLVWNIENAQRVELHYAGNMKVLKSNGEKDVSPKFDTEYKIKATALDGKTTIEKSVKIQVFNPVVINKFKADKEYIIESLSIRLSWNVDNATKLTLSSNYEKDEDVTKQKSITRSPKKDTTYFLKASNDLFKVKELIKVRVDAIPRVPHLPDIIPSDKLLVPKLDLSFGEVAKDIMMSSNFEFDKLMEEKKRFSLKESLDKLLKWVHIEDL